MSLRGMIHHNYSYMLQEGRDMVIGTDLDALLSASYLHHKLGWRVVGIYDLECVRLVGGATWEDAKRAVWVDLDIARADIASIGHHVLTWKNAPRDLVCAHKQSLNPNLIRGIDTSQFTKKCPISTILFLLWLFDEPIDLTNTNLCLLWCADSCNKLMGQYEPNMTDWIENWFPHSFLLETMWGWSSKSGRFLEDYQRRMDGFAGVFGKHSPVPLWDVVRGRGVEANMVGLLTLVSGIMGWSLPTLPRVTKVLPCERKKMDIGYFNYTSDLLSCVVPFAGKLNCTYARW